MSGSEEELYETPLTKLKREQVYAATETISRLNAELAIQEEEVDRLTRRIEQTRLVLDETRAQWKAIYVDRIRPTLRQGLLIVCLFLGLSMGVAPHLVKFLVLLGFSVAWWIV